MPTMRTMVWSENSGWRHHSQVEEICPNEPFFLFEKINSKLELPVRNDDPNDRAQSNSNRLIRVQIQQGTLEGEILEAVPTGAKYYSFKGIPYAKPPVGDLRFMAPQDPEPWEGVRDATAHGAVCPQFNIISAELIPGSEDCLFLNVYTPTLTPDSPLPVLVSIPGGGYRFGSGDTDIYGPDFLVTKDVVVVTLNYRLDALGFLTAGTCDLPGNAGLKDQVAALKWVQNNIKCFGGNPNSVTVIGESAAASSITYHLLSPMSKGLFNRAIAMSGSLLCDWNTSFKPARQAFIIANKLGFDTTDVRKLVKFFKSVSSEKLINNKAEVMAFEELGGVIFKMQFGTPVIEKDCGKDSFLTINPMDLLKSGKVNKVDLMFSYNEYEGLFGIPLYKIYIERLKRYPELFVPSNILINSTAFKILDLAEKIQKKYFGNKSVSIDNFKEFIDYINGASFVYGIQKFFRYWPEVGSRYFFKFTSYSSRNYFGLKALEYGINGTSHFDDIFYIYDPKSLKMNLNIDSIEYKMIQQLTTAITNFVKYGNPTPDKSLGVMWPEFNPDTLPYVNIGKDLTVGYAPDEDLYQFWDSIYEEAGMPI